MTFRQRLPVAAPAVVAPGTAACTPAANRETGTTTIIERGVAVPAPPVVIETARRADSTTARAGREPIAVGTTNRQSG